MTPFDDYLIPREPFLFATAKQVAAIPAKVRRYPWAAEIARECLQIAEPWAGRAREEWLRFIPEAGARYSSTAIKPVDPETGELLEWCGWGDPFAVANPQGRKYRDGAPFDALANTGRVADLENRVLPALATAWIVTGDERYALSGMRLFDAIAAVHPGSTAGPYNYPNLPPEGGRLYRPLFQVARGLMRYAYSYEILATHPGMDAPSSALPSLTLRENLLANLFGDAGRFCFEKVRQSPNLTNGTIDYNRGVMIAGALLGIPEYLEHAFNGLEMALANAVDPAGQYYETSPGYASHTIHLLLSLARLADGVNRHRQNPGPSFFDHPRLATFCIESFSAIQAAGRLPAFGDAGPDRKVAADDRWFDPVTYFSCLEFLDRSGSPAIRQKAARQLHEMVGEGGLDTLCPAKLAALKQHSLYLAENVLLLHPEADGSSFPEAGPAQSRVLPFSGTALLRHGAGCTGEKVALMRYGATCPHGHKDEMALQLFAFGRELSGDPGYFNTHYRVGFTLATVAHNLVTAERQSQHEAPSAGGRLLSWNAGTRFASVEADDPDAYRHLALRQYQRRVAAVDCDGVAYWIDLFRVRGAREYDYGFHALPNAEVSIIGGAQFLERREGSLYSESVDFGADLQGDGRLRSFPEKEFGWSPPGHGYGFLRNPARHRPTGTLHLEWRSREEETVRVHWHHLAPPGAELHTAHLSAPGGIMETDYALSRAGAAPETTVRYTSVIRPSNVESPTPWNVLPIEAACANQAGDPCGVEIRGTGEGENAFLHRHYSSDRETEAIRFADGTTLQSAREGFAAFAPDGTAATLSLSGAGSFSCGGVALRCASPLGGGSKIIAIKEAPLRILVSECGPAIEKALGMILRIGAYRAPLAFHLLAAQREGDGCWLTLNADGAAQSLVVVSEVNGLEIIIANPLPRVTPLLDLPYNGGFDGYRLCSTSHPETGARIRTLSADRRRIHLETPLPGVASGDRLRIEAPAVGDGVALLPWAQATRREGGWHVEGLGEIVDDSGAAPISDVQ